MKVMLVNGSCHTEGTTQQALNEMIKMFDQADVETEVYKLGSKPIADCMGCGACAKLGRCIIDDDMVNEFVEKAREADGFVFGTPVYYAHPSGRVLSFMDRAFYSGKSAFMFKPACGVVVARRGGCSATFDAMNKYFGICNMPVAGSSYWNSVHGAVAEDAPKDEEGMQVMRNLARHMTWLMKSIDAGRAAGLALPEVEATYKTNFVR